MVMYRLNALTAPTTGGFPDSENTLTPAETCKRKRLQNEHKKYSFTKLLGVFDYFYYTFYAGIAYDHFVVNVRYFVITVFRGFFPITVYARARYRDSPTGDSDRPDGGTVVRQLVKLYDM